MLENLKIFTGTPGNLEVTTEINSQIDQIYLQVNSCNNVVHSRYSIKYLLNELIIIQKKQIVFAD